MVGRSVWGAKEISMPLGSNEEEVKLTCFQETCHIRQLTTGKNNTKIYAALLWMMVIRKPFESSVKWTFLLPNYLMQSRNADFENIKKCYPFSSNK